jgi:hypothetical protein
LQLEQQEQELQQLAQPQRVQLAQPQRVQLALEFQQLVLVLPQLGQQRLHHQR